jgi:hypothetical protein
MTTIGESCRSQKAGVSTKDTPVLRLLIGQICPGRSRRERRMVII